MNAYWWFRPSRIALLVVMPMATVAFLASNSLYQEFGATNVMTDEHFFFMWLSILGFAGASWIGEIMVPNRPAPPALRVPEARYRKAMLTLAAIAILAVAIFLAPFALRPDFIFNVFTGVPGAAAEARLYVNQIPGITSQENLSCLAVVLFMLKERMTGYRLRKSEKAIFAVILVLMAMKVVMHGERLALIELLVPIGLLVCSQRKRSALWSLAPFFAVIGMFVFFTGTEYLRSWVAYYADRFDSLLGFAVTRIMAYYITAFNNGAVVYEQGHSYFFPVYTGGWLWRLPIPGLEKSLLSMTGVFTLDINVLLAEQNIEFNNVSGIFAPLIDFGPLLGVACWLVLGFVSGRLYRLFAQAYPLGLILFPTWYIGVLEMAREFYWGDNRYFPPLVASLAVVALFRPASRSIAASVARHLPHVIARRLGDPRRVADGSRRGQWADHAGERGVAAPVYERP